MKNIHSICSIALAATILTFTGYACSSDSDSNVANNIDSAGAGGSMARFTIAGDHLYAVDYQILKTVRLTDPRRPEHLDLRDQQLGFDIETIFPYGDKLFIGAQSGMYIYDISRPEFPEHLSTTTHFTSCDPVVAAGNHAYVTLSSSTNNWNCWRGDNVLQVYDITDPEQPVLLKSQPMHSPKGLGVDAEAALLFVCDKGLKVYDISDPSDPRLFWDLQDEPEIKYIETYDCIPMNGILMVIGADGLYQFDYSDRNNIHLVGKIDLRKDRL